ncbi:hypothetical protein J2N86_08345 [Legionella lytica]|uniref:Transmembrane protein n=1 Tax=Legionella lytica TaxID=96232 RepID=A0ABY4Y532_9GAMM|nr:hypothetical protein [Legionella lytica]USQ12720.1 hypothetical protein J2N86_08345 [Legionella lytica]
MLILAICLFLLAATFGIAILVAILQDLPVNKIALIGHGLVAGLAIAIMVTYLIIYGIAPLLLASLILFLLAAMGGLTLFIMGRKEMKVPKLLVFIHPLVALAGLITLVIYVLP